MPIAYRDGISGSDVEGALALTIPATVQAGDLMVVTYHVALDTAPVDLPAGWTYLPDGTAAPHLIGSSRVGGFYKVASGDDAGTVLSLAVTAGAPVKQTAVLSAWSGIDQVTPIHKATFAANGTPTGTSHPSPQVTTTLDGCVILQTTSFKDSSVAVITAPTGYTDRGSVTMTGGGRSSTAHASKSAATGGTYGGEAWTTDAIPSSSGMFAVAVAPQIATQTARPVSDVTVTNATNQDLGTVDLYTTIDEANLDINDYVRTVEGAVYEALLATLTAPPSESGFQAKYALGLGDGATTATWDVYLMQGATQIAHWTDVITTDNTSVTHTLTAAEFAAITDWSDLRLRWVATDLSG